MYTRQKEKEISKAIFQKNRSSMEVDNPALLSEHIELTPEIKFYLYFLWLDGEIVYIGQTTNIDSRMKSHTDKLFDKKTYKIYEGIDKAEMLRIERANILKYNPIYNDNTKTLLRKPGYCFHRDNKKCTKFQKGQLYSEDDSKKVYYYDGVDFYEYRTYSEKVLLYINDILQEKEILLNGIKSIDWKVSENKLTYTLNRGYTKSTSNFEKSSSAKVLSREMLLETVINFGKYKGNSIMDIIKRDYLYVHWMIRDIWKGKISDKVKDSLKKADTTKRARK